MPRAELPRALHRLSKHCPPARSFGWFAFATVTVVVPVVEAILVLDVVSAMRITG